MKRIFLFILFLFTSLAYSQTKDTKEHTFYEQGIIALEKNNIESAVELLERSGKREKNPEAYFALSKIFAKDTSVNSYNKARERIKEAIALDKNNINYYMHFAELLKILFKINFFDKDALLRAEDQYNKVLEIDGEYAPAYYELAKLYEKYFYESYGSEVVELDYAVSKEKMYKNDKLKEEWNNFINNLFEEGSYASLKMDKEAEKVFQKAVFYFEKTVKYDNSNVKAYYKPALMNSLIKKYNKAIEILNSANGKFLNNSNYNLAYAYNYYKLKNFTASQKYFKDAFALMDEDKRYEYKVGSVLEILNPDFAAKLISLSREKQELILNQYWEIKDPLLLSPENERLLEHFSRVFYADYFLSSYDPYTYFPYEIDTTGWKTERGITALRYGEPIEQRVLLPAFDLAGQKDFAQRFSNKTDFWDYGDFKLSFKEYSNRKNYKLGGYDFGNKTTQYSNDSKTLYDNLIIQTPERYIPEFKGPIINLPLSVYQLKELDKTNVYLTYGLPEIKNLNSFSHKYGVFYFDNRMSLLYNNKNDLQEPNTNSKLVLPHDSVVVINTVSNKLKPGDGNMNFELIRTGDDAVFTMKGKMAVKNYNTNDLALSDVVLAADIKINDKPGTTFSRGIYNILPNPAKIFSNEIPLYIYYEIYNLEKGANNLTDFEQQITIREYDKEEGLSEILNSLGDLIGIDNKGSEISLSSNYSTIERDPQIYLQLDFSSYDTGEYLITVNVKDNLTGKTTTSDARITWK